MNNHLTFIEPLNELIFVMSTNYVKNYLVQTL